MAMLKKCHSISWKQPEAGYGINHTMMYIIHENISYWSCLIVEQSTKGSHSTFNSYKDLIAICSRGGFTLTQWISNSREVLQSIPEELRSKTLHELDLDRDKLPVDRALSLQWCIETDSFKFKQKWQISRSRGVSNLKDLGGSFVPNGIISQMLVKLAMVRLLTSKCKTPRR